MRIQFIFLIILACYFSCAQNNNNSNVDDGFIPCAVDVKPILTVCQNSEDPKKCTIDRLREFITNDFNRIEFTSLNMSSSIRFKYTIDKKGKLIEFDKTFLSKYMDEADKIAIEEAIINIKQRMIEKKSLFISAKLNGESVNGMGSFLFQYDFTNLDKIAKNKISIEDVVPPKLYQLKPEDKIQLKDSLMYFIKELSRLNQDSSHDYGIQCDLERHQQNPSKYYSYRKKKCGRTFKDSKMVNALIYAQLNKLDSAFLYLNSVQDTSDFIFKRYCITPPPTVLFEDERIGKLLNLNYQKLLSDSPKLTALSDSDKEMAITLLVNEVLHKNSFRKSNNRNKKSTFRRNLSKYIKNQQKGFYDKYGFPTLDKYNSEICKSIGEYILEVDPKIFINDLTRYEQLMRKGLLNKRISKLIKDHIDKTLVLKGSLQKYGTVKSKMNLIGAYVPYQTKDSIFSFSVYKKFNSIDTLTLGDNISLEQIMQTINQIYQSGVDTAYIQSQIKRNLSYLEHYKEKNKHNSIINYNRKLGFSHTHLNNLDSAFYYFKKSDFSEYRWARLDYSIVPDKTPSMSFLIDKQSDIWIDTFSINKLSWDGNKINKSDALNTNLYKEFKILQLVGAYINNVRHNDSKIYTETKILKTKFNTYKVNRCLSLIKEIPFPDLTKHGSYVTDQVFRILWEHYPNYIIENINLFEKLMLEGNFPDVVFLANLIDEKKIMQGEDQKYGTKVISIRDKDNQLVYMPYLIAERQTVNKKRKSIGLIPIEEMLEKGWGNLHTKSRIKNDKAAF